MNNGLLYQPVRLESVADFAGRSNIPREAVYSLVENVKDFPVVPWGNKTLVLCPDADAWIRIHRLEVFKMSHKK